MRWTNKKPKDDFKPWPKDWDTKIKVEFLWSTVKIGDDVSWLELAAIEYAYCDFSYNDKYGHELDVWIPTRFVN